MRMRFCICVCIATMLNGCFVPAPRIPPTAEDQTPRAGPSAAWGARGRLSLNLPGRAIGLAAFLRPSEAGEVRMVLMEDGGLMVADISHAGSGTVVHHCRDEVIDALPVLEALTAAVWTPSHPDAMQVRTGLKYEDDGAWRRWYGGDPVVLRYVHGRGWPMTVGDYRVAEGLLIAHRVYADGPWGTELTLELEAVTQGDAPPP